MPATIPAIDPATGSVFAETPVTPPEAVPLALQRARLAQPAWAARPYRERWAVLARFRDLVYRARGDLAELVTRENGKPLAESLLADVAVTLDLARYYLARGERMLRPRRIRHGNIAFLGKHGWVHWEPLGVIGVIAPWNYPLFLPAGTIFPALLAGNAVLFKPSEFTVRTGVRLVELLHEAGVPPECCQLLVGGGDVGAALVEAGPDKIFFTGSAATGRLVARRAGERLIPVSLELGGSDPCIVLADADLDHATSGVIWARFANGGQTCVAAKRAIVQRPVFEPFVNLLAAKVRALELGPGLRAGADVGPLIRESQLRVLEEQLEDAVRQGARVVTGGRRRPDLGPTFFEPTVVVDVPRTSRLWREEVFGPVLPVVAVDDVEEAIRVANDSRYSLAGSLWTRDRRRGLALARRIEAGAVLVNDAASHVGAVEAPHGGMKESGPGRIHAEFGLLETCRARFVGGDRLDWMRKPWWFGYHPESYAHRDAFVRLAFGPRLRERLRALPGALRLLWNPRRI